MCYLLLPKKGMSLLLELLILLEEMQFLADYGDAYHKSIIQVCILKHAITRLGFNTPGNSILQLKMAYNSSS